MLLTGGHFSPVEINDDVSILTGYFTEPERSNSTPHTKRLLENTPHFVLTHLPGKTYDPGWHKHVNIMFYQALT